jgi:hypothetical protein
MSKLNSTVTLILAIISISISGLSFADADSNRAKIKALYDVYDNGTVEEFTAAYGSMMADDFYSWTERYIGLGFGMSDDGETIERVLRSPAIDHLKSGDKVISVNGILASSDEDLPFQGLVGGEVTIILMRNGKKMTVSMARAVQFNTNDKANMISWMSTWDPKNWTKRATRLSLNPIVAEGNEVYASYEHSQKNDEGIDVIGWTIERYVFNEAGDLVLSANLDESLFMAAQNGYFLEKQ